MAEPQGRVRGADFPFATEARDRIPAQRYYDSDFFELERERLWPRVWQMACRLEEIPRVGDTVEYEILGRSLIIARTGEDEIKAYHNVCRHRGMKLVEGRGHRPQGFTCRFHGWCWALDGSNKHVFAPNVFDPALLDPDAIRLEECRSEIWGGCVFVNFDDGAPPLRPSLEPFATYHDALRVELMRTEAWLETILPVNWKLVGEAFMEGYHAEQTHPQLLARSAKQGYTAGTDPLGFTDPEDVIGSSIYFMKTLSEGMGGGMIHARDIAVAETLRDMELPSEPLEAVIEWNQRLNDEITKRARADGIPMPDLNELIATGHVSSVNYCFPNFWLLPVYGNAASYRIRPIGPEETRMEVWTTTLMPAGTDHVPPPEPTFLAHDDPRWGEVVRQDFANLPLQQAGVRSPGFDAMRLARDVEGMVSNFHRTIDGYLAGRAHDELLPAIQKTSGPIDAVIADIDL